MLKINKKLVLLAALATSTAYLGCEDDNDSTLPAFDMPGALHLVTQCIIDNTLVDVSQCEAKNIAKKEAVFVANTGDGTLAYVPFDGREFDVVDITLSVPGVTSLPVGERPQALASDSKGAILLVTSSIMNNLSIVSAYEHREVAFQELDKPARRIAYQASDDAFYVFFLDGTVRRVKVSYNCGYGSNVYKAGCMLNKDKLLLEWGYVTSLDGTISDYVADPRGDRGYVSFSDRRYVSVIAYSASAGTCMDGSSSYPCESSRIGTGYACADGIDNNGDGTIDHEDPSCFYPWSTEGYSTGDPKDATAGIAGQTECNDVIDNNGDGLMDALDPNCVSSDDASEEPGYQPIQLGTCADGIDNDGDGFIDRDDPSCIWPTDNETSDDFANRRTTGLCMDGVDNDGDTVADNLDSGCYGRLGMQEGSTLSTGRGQLGIDPKSRWLYVVNPGDSELIIVDLETQKTIDLTGRFPRQRSIGVPISRLPMDVTGDVISYTSYSSGKQKVYVDDAVAYVSSTSGIVYEVAIQKVFKHYNDGKLVNEVPLMTLMTEDDDGDNAYIGVSRCVGRLCGDHDVVNVEIRKRPVVEYNKANNVIGTTSPESGLPYSSTYDGIMASETWRVTYEGPLEKTTREDGYFVKDGVFKTTSVEFCALGAREGDRLVITSKKGLNTSIPGCEALSKETLEWTITGVHPESLDVAPTGISGYASSVPLKKCFPNVMAYEVRASDAWLITSNSTYINRRMPIGDRCLDNPANLFGSTRFKLDSERDKSLPDATTAFFKLYMPDAAFNLVRDDAYEFTTKAEYSIKGVSVGSAPSSIMAFSNDDVHYLLVSEGSANTVIIYDVDDDSVYDSL